MRDGFLSEFVASIDVRRMPRFHGFATNLSLFPEAEDCEARADAAQLLGNLKEALKEGSLDKALPYLRYVAEPFYCNCIQHDMSAMQYWIHCHHELFNELVDEIIKESGYADRLRRAQPEPAPINIPLGNNC